MPNRYKKISSPVGILTLVCSEKGLCAVLWEKDSFNRVPVDKGMLQEDHPLLLETEKQLGEYFSGTRQNFSLPLDFSGTEFQKRVWTALLNIPYGDTRSYSQIAVQLNSPNAVRAVGAANGKNPISIIAPCHRVIGANGKLTGFAGGMKAKEFLLALETPAAPTLFTFARADSV